MNISFNQFDESFSPSSDSDNSEINPSLFKTREYSAESDKVKI